MRAWLSPHTPTSTKRTSEILAKCEVQFRQLIQILKCLKSTYFHQSVSSLWLSPHIPNAPVSPLHPERFKLVNCLTPAKEASSPSRNHGIAGEQDGRQVTSSAAPAGVVPARRPQPDKSTRERFEKGMKSSSEREGMFRPLKFKLATYFGSSEWKRRATSRRRNRTAAFSAFDARTTRSARRPRFDPMR
jgi:hypothetical protein